MKIAKVHTYHLQSKVARPFTFSRGWVYATRTGC